jgi:hypothetical protein
MIDQKGIPGMPVIPFFIWEFPPCILERKRGALHHVRFRTAMHPSWYMGNLLSKLKVFVYDRENQEDGFV